jgi:5-methylcytosine-specific restriction endonuclease McrA
MPVRRPCLERGCREYADGSKSRCPAHEAEYERKRKTPSQKIAQTSKWRTLRARLIRKRRRSDGTWMCALCNAPITDQRDIELDHIVPVSVDESRAFDESNLRVVHRTCNRSRKRVRADVPGSPEWRAARAKR